MGPVQHEGSSVHLQGGGETRLADARLAREQHHAAVTVFCAIPLAPQQVDLLLAPDERRQRRLVQRLETALRFT